MLRSLTSLFVLAILIHPSVSLANTDLSAEDRMRSCDPAVAIAAAEEILADQDILFEPLSMFPPITALFLNGKKDEAVFWFYAAQLRTRYQLVFEKGDRGQLLTIMMMTTGGLINNYAFQNLDRWSEIMDRVIEWDKNTYNPYRIRKHTAQDDKDIEKIYSGFAEIKQKVLAEKSEYEKKARQIAPQIEKTYSNYKCDKNPQPRTPIRVAIKPDVRQFAAIVSGISYSWRYNDLKRYLHKTLDNEEQFVPMLKRAAYLGPMISLNKPTAEDSDIPIRGAVKFSAIGTFANGSAKVTALIKQSKGRGTNDYELYEFDIAPLDSPIKVEDPRLALDAAIQEGVIRKATPADAKAWLDAFREKYARKNLPPPDIDESTSILNAEIAHTYVVLKKFTYPPGLKNEDRAIFLIPSGVPEPSGDYGHSEIYDFATLSVEFTAASPRGLKW